MTDTAALWQEILAPGFDVTTDQSKVDQVLEAALNSDIKTEVSFGTSGWRGDS